MAPTGVPKDDIYERSDLISGVRKGLNDAGFSNYPIMAGVLINGTEEAVRWLEDAEKAGAQWGPVMTPGYFGAQSSQEGIIQWFIIVADRSPIPVLPYNYPIVTNGVMMKPDTHVALASHPNIVECKMYVRAETRSGSRPEAMAEVTAGTKLTRQWDE